MIPITDPRIEEYLMRFAPESDPFLLKMERLAKEREFPIVNRLVGRLLYLLTRVKNPSLVVELGSGFGYSAWWFARAISISSKVVMTDSDEANLSFARNMFQENGLIDRVDLRLGDALELGRQYQEIDILFIDVDKHQYLEAIQAMLPSLAKNALVIADNTLWYGKVAEGADDPETRGIQEFNQFMFNRRDFFTTILPLRDGVMLAYKLG
jgi:predicted O-methyltransferase YrrM